MSVFNKCCFCNVIKRTPIHVTEIFDKTTVLQFHICQECYLASEKSLLQKLQKKLSPQTQSPQEVLNFLTTTKNSCECGWTLQHFETYSRFGCPQCYNFFSNLMTTLVFPYHGGNHHVGKKPHCHVQLSGLNLQLAKAIEEERFEQASEIKNRIQRISDPPVL